MAVAEQIVDTLAEQGVDVDEAADDRRGKFRKYLLQILNKPGRRNNGMLTAALVNVAAEVEREYGDPEFVERMAAGIQVYLGVGWLELHSVPIENRGESWRKARAIILAVARRQAAIESGIASGEIELGLKHFAARASLVKKAGRKGLQAAAKIGFREARNGKAADRKAARNGEEG